MPRTISALMLALLPAAAQSQPAAQPVEIALSSFKFRPNIIRLRHGEHYVLRLTNTGGGGHNFSAEEFFAAARVSQGTAVHGGTVELNGHQSVSVDLIAPPPGTYRVRCSHLLHSTFGMTGTIVVE